MSTLSLILRQVVNGLQSGSIYALVALGYSMVYGIIMLLNFAHGDIIMVGGLAIGLAEAMVSAVGLSVWKDGIVFAILIVVLLVKPTGIMGHEIQEKV